MKKTLYLALALMPIYPFATFADGFKVDVSVMEAINKFNVLNIGSLAVGESGLVSTYQLRMCIDDGTLKISSISELNSSPSQYGYDFEATRHPNDTVVIAFSHKGKTPDDDAVKQAVLRTVGASDCNELKKEKIPLFSVTKFLGANSVKSLVSQIRLVEKQDNSPRNFGEHDQGPTNKTATWQVLESRSAIDDSPTVTLIRSANTGNQALVLRCKENTTNAYILTDDYLGDDSRNVTVRYDSKKAGQQKFSLSTNNRALFFNRAITNIKRMLKSEQLVVRYYSYDGTASTVTFILDGLKDSIEPLRTACHW